MAFAKVLKLANSVLSTVATVTAIAVMSFSGYMIYENQYVQTRAYASNRMEFKPRTQEEIVSIEALLEKIPEATGWITLDDTHIDYPIVQGTDDVYYASHDENKKPSLTGSIYMQAKNKYDFSDTYTLLYGHHMDNGAMFGDLSNYTDIDFFNEHLTGSLVTLKEVYDIEVISLFSTDAYEKEIYERTSLNWNTYTTSILNSPDIELIHSNPKIKSADKFLVLSTCSGVATNGRYVLICRITKANKKIEPLPTVTPDPDNKGAKIVKTGEHGNGVGWSVVNLFCLALTFLNVVPFIPDRKRDDSDVDEKTLKKNKRKGYIGLVGTILTSIVAAWIFVTHENMKLPMIIIDKYTPWMLITLSIAMVIEEICYKQNKKTKNTRKESADA